MRWSFLHWINLQFSIIKPIGKSSFYDNIFPLLLCKLCVCGKPELTEPADLADQLVDAYDNLGANSEHIWASLDWKPSRVWPGNTRTGGVSWRATCWPHSIPNLTSTDPSSGSFQVEIYVCVQINSLNSRLSVCVWKKDARKKELPSLVHVYGPFTNV